MGQFDTTVSNNEPKDETLSKLESAVYTSKKLQDDVEMIGMKIKHHEENVKFLKNEKNMLEDSIFDLQVVLGKYHSSSSPMIKNEDCYHEQNKEETVGYILRQDKSAASILWQMKTCHGTHTSHILLTKDVLGIVATLGEVEDDNLSSLLSEYLGLGTMLAVVCKTFDSVKSLEAYDREGSIIKSSGLHGLGASMGRSLEGRFRVICLESLRPYNGKFVADDPQRRLDLLRPKLPNGESPSGFLGFAVNMIDVDTANLYRVTAHGEGLREALFYHLFSHVQVYKTRAEMLHALPYIRDGALSLDGGMIRSTGVFLLGTRENVNVKFLKSSLRTCPPENYFSTEKKIKEMKWEKDRIIEDLQREQALMDQARFNYEVKKQDFIKFITESANAAQVQPGVKNVTLK